MTWHQTEMQSPCQRKPRPIATARSNLSRSGQRRVEATMTVGMGRSAAAQSANGSNDAPAVRIEAAHKKSARPNSLSTNGPALRGVGVTLASRLTSHEVHTGAIHMPKTAAHIFS